MSAERKAFRMQRWAATIAFVIALTPASAQARNRPCTPVQIAADTSRLPEPWRHALEVLVRATSEEGMPWSCPASSVDLVLTTDGALLTVLFTDGRSVSRSLPSPDQLVPTAEALLATPLSDPSRTDKRPEPPPPPPPPPTPPPREPPRLPPAPTVSEEPRLQI